MSCSCRGEIGGGARGTDGVFPGSRIESGYVPAEMQGSKEKIGSKVGSRDIVRWRMSHELWSYPGYVDRLVLGFSHEHLSLFSY